MATRTHLECDSLILPFRFYIGLVHNLYYSDGDLTHIGPSRLASLVCVWGGGGGGALSL